MSLVATHTFEEGTDGATLTNGTDGIVTTTNAKYESSAAVHGSMGVEAVNVAATIGYSCANSGQASIYWPGYAIGTGSTILWSLRSTAVIRVRMRVNPTTGKYEMTDNANAVVATSAASINALVPGRADIRWVYNSGAGTVTVTCRLYLDSNIEGDTPDETLTGTNMAIPAALDRFYFGTTVANGWTTRCDTIRLYDDVVTWPEPFDAAPPPTGNYIYSMAGGVRDTTAEVVTKTELTTSLKLKYSVNSDMSSPSSTIVLAPDAHGYVHWSLTGLTADTKYYYQLTDTVDSVETAFGDIGVFRTRPASASTGTIKIAAMSCVLTNVAVTDFGGVVPGLQDALAWDPHYMAHLGDAYYDGPNNTTTTDPQVHRAIWESQVTDVVDWKALLSGAAIEYTNSDHELNPDNCDSNTDTALSFNEFFRQTIPSIPLVKTGVNPVSKHRSWVDSNIRFIMLDVKNTQRSPGLNTDNSSKTMLGTDQLAWFLDQLSQPELLKVVLCDVPWARTAVVNTAGQDKWWAYGNERQIIANYITANGINVDYIHGDAHRLGVDETHNTWGGFPIMSCSPLANVSGGTQTDGFWDATWPTTGIGSSNISVYMRITYEWLDSNTLQRTASGWDATADVERVNMVTTWVRDTTPVNPWVKDSVGDAVAATLYRNVAGSPVAIGAITVAP